MSEVHLSELSGRSRRVLFDVFGEKSSERGTFSLQNAHKGRTYGSLFPQVKTKLAPEVNLQWYCASSEHPPGATLA